MPQARGHSLTDPSPPGCVRLFLWPTILLQLQQCIVCIVGMAMMSGPHVQMFVTSEQSLRKTSRSSSSDLISTQALHIESQRLLLSCARCQRTTLPCIAPRKGCTALNPMLTSSSSCCSSCPALGLCPVCFQDLEA